MISAAVSRRTTSVGKSLLTVIMVVALTTLAACGGGSDKPGQPAGDRLAAAKTKLDEAKAVTISLKTPELPKGTQGILSATGTGTDAPAFKGRISVIQSGLSVEVPVIAVDGSTYIQFGNTWQTIDPREFGAPDPAKLFTEGGLSTVLTEVKNAKAGEDTRDGKQILSTISGTVPGSSVRGIIPTAANQDFAAKFVLDDANTLVSAKLTGPFYSTENDVTYDLKFSDYGKTISISKP